MVNSLVLRATSDLLIGPDWALNIGIAEICNRDPMEAKDVVRGVKKRLGSKNPKVQLLALALLEILVQRCGDIVHMYVAEKDVLRKMVKIMRKKPDFHVQEKILILIDTWQEAFGARSRYPQYFAAYQELLRMGLVFPRRSQISVPVFTPPQMQRVSSYPQNRRNPEFQQEEAESSGEPEFPTLSLTEIQNARGTMYILAEMLSAISAENKEGLKQEVVIDLVEQCRTYKQRVVHLVNSTSDESLLCQGLALNDDLQKVLATHEELSEGTPKVKEKAKTEAVGAVTSVDDLLIDTGDNKQIEEGSTSRTVADTHLLSASANPIMDLLSGDNFSSPKAENPREESGNGPSHQNALALVDAFSQNNAATLQLQEHQNFQSPELSVYHNGSASSMISPQHEHSLYVQGANDIWNDHMSQQQPPPPPSSVYGNENSSSFPPPPWEAQPEGDNSLTADNEFEQPIQTSQVGVTPGGVHPQEYQHMENHRAANVYIQPVTGGHLSASDNLSMKADHRAEMCPQQSQGSETMGMPPQQMQHGQMGYMYPQQIQGSETTCMLPQQMQYGQMSYMYPQQIQGSETTCMLPQQMQYGQMGYMYPQQMYSNQIPGYGYGYGYGQQQENQFIEQRMSGLSVRDDGVSNDQPIVSYVPSGKPSKQVDSLFGDLVDIKKFKPTDRT